jgi:uncharacterized membrane protein YidH (DUF202 family)
MHEGANGAGRTNALLAAILVGLMIVVAVLGLLMFNDHRGRHNRTFDRPSVMPLH